MLKIDKSKLILTEGMDAYRFIIWSIEFFGINDIQVLNFGGISELTGYLKLLKMDDGFDKVSSILILRDAEVNADNSIQSIKSSLSNNRLPVPEGPFMLLMKDNLKVGYGIFPGLDDNDNLLTEGTLEDLCLKIISDTAYLECINTFMECACTIEEISHPHKSKLHAYFSCTNKYVGMKIGEAARSGAFDWNNIAFKPFRNMILSL